MAMHLLDYTSPENYRQAKYHNLLHEINTAGNIPKASTDSATKALNQAETALNKHLEKFPNADSQGKPINDATKKAYLIKKTIEFYQVSQGKGWRTKVPKSLEQAEKDSSLNDETLQALNRLQNTTTLIKEGTHLVHQYATANYTLKQLNEFNKEVGKRTEGLPTLTDLYRDSSAAVAKLQEKHDLAGTGKSFEVVVKDAAELQTQNANMERQAAEKGQPFQEITLQGLTDTLAQCPPGISSEAQTLSQSASVNLKALTTLQNALLTADKKACHGSTALVEEYKARRKAFIKDINKLQAALEHAHIAKHALARRSSASHVQSYANSVLLLNQMFNKSKNPANHFKNKKLTQLGDIDAGNLSCFDPVHNSKMTSLVQARDGTWVPGTMCDREGKELQWDDEAMELFLKELHEKGIDKFLKRSKCPPFGYDITRDDAGRITHLGFKKGALKMHAVENIYAPILRNLQHQRNTQSADATGHAEKTGADARVELNPGDQHAAALTA